MYKFYPKNFVQPPRCTAKVLLVMKLTTLLLITAILQVSANTFAQKITLSEKKVPIQKVFDQIRAQTSYDFIFSDDVLKDINPISIQVKNADLKSVLTRIFQGQPLEYSIEDKSIVVSKKESSLFDKIKTTLQIPKTVAGKVTDTTGTPLVGATIINKTGTKAILTNDKGEFILTAQSGDQITVSFIGYEPYIFTLSESMSFLQIVLHQSYNKLNEVVVSTGLQKIPKERATGSFTLIDSALFNRRVSTNVLDHLNGVTSGLYFNGTQQNRNLSYGSSVLGINVRGQSTLSTNVNKDPLIVLDNFPYEGNINNLNPNDIESITVLKDAAAASIWGARSGNGVIVITTKKGKYNQKPVIEFNANTTVGNKPNIFKDKKFVDATDYINIEKYLYGQGYYTNDISNTTNRPALSPVIDILSSPLNQADKDAQINALLNNDYRRDYEKYFYQKSINQQYSIGIRGGGNNNIYAFSVGYDHNEDNLVKNGLNRLTINAQNTYTPLKNLDITGTLYYTNSKTLRGNQLPYGTISVGGKYGQLYPYAQLADASGNALPIVKDYRTSYVTGTAATGFLNWQYRPLDEINNAEAFDKTNDLLFRISTRYKFTSFLNAEVLFQNETQNIDTYDYFNTQTYYTRNLINKYSQYNATTKTITYPIPNGGILNLGNYDWMSNNGRIQLNYNQNLGNDNQITAIAGTEIREITTQNYLRTSYGYDDTYGTSVANLNYNTSYATNPSGSATISAPPGLVNGQTFRYLSYYANGAYTYKGRYTATVSGRKDGSNIFGVKTNDKITPLWSAGLGWDVSDETFYKVAWLPYLKLRASYGFNGNIYNGSAYTTGMYSTSADLTGAQIISNLTAPNPELQWEKVKNINFGIDFAIFNKRINGTVELWQKKGLDLINDIPLASSTGFSSFTGNSAATRTNGIDLQFNSQNLKGKFGWSTSLLFNLQHDKVIQYNVTQTATSIQTYYGVALVGKPLYSIFSYKWAGLDPTNGDPQGYLNGKVSKDYTGIINNFKPDSLVFNGSARPTVFGSIKNDFTYRNFALSINIVYKAGYYFRKPSTSINYSDVIALNGYSDVAQRWQKPGDENTTTVPSLVYPGNANRNNFYQYSSVLIDKGDHVRLQDIRVSYNITRSVWKRMPFRNCQIYAYANNLGILWRANKDGLDPDVVGSNATPYLLNPFTLAFGLNLSL